MICYAQKNCRRMCFDFMAVFMYIQMHMACLNAFQNGSRQMTSGYTSAKEICC